MSMVQEWHWVADAVFWVANHAFEEQRGGDAWSYFDVDLNVDQWSKEVVFDVNPNGTYDAHVNEAQDDLLKASICFYAYA
jgi:hypothetical protein